MDLLENNTFQHDTPLIPSCCPGNNMTTALNNKNAVRKIASTVHNEVRMRVMFSNVNFRKYDKRYFRFGDPIICISATYLGNFAYMQINIYISVVYKINTILCFQYI